MAKRRNTEEMYPLIVEWERSGLNQSEFCKQKGIIYSVFGYWRSKYLESQALSAHPATPPAFKELLPSIRDQLALTYPNGVVLTLPAGTALSHIRALIALV